MARKRAIADTGHATDTRPEFAFLGLLIRGPMHGYDLYSRFRDTLGRVWRVSQSQMYTVLKRLESQGHIEPLPATGSTGQERRVFAPTPAGIRHFSDWLRKPTDCSARVLRVEFITRIHFALIEERALALALVAEQEAHLERELRNHSRILESIDPLDRLGALSFEFRVRQIVSEIAWLRDCALPFATGLAGRVGPTSIDNPV